MENRTILIVVLVAVLLLYTIFFAYILVRYVMPRQNAMPSISNDSVDTSRESVDFNSPYQTDFFKKSSEHATKVLFGKSFDPQYGESNYYGNKLIDVVNKLNDETKQSIIIAIKYFSIEPSQTRFNEQMFRSMSDQEKVPLWFVVLREAVKKVVPEFTSSDASIQSNNVVPLYATG